jgi:hypothetical protein
VLIELTKQGDDMNVYSKLRRGSQSYYYQVNAMEFSSLLEIPDGKNPTQNSWLTITINYEFDFVDSKNLGGVIYKKDGKFYAKDSDRNEFSIRDWDFNSQIEFNRRFRRCEEFWNYKFLLITPLDYAELDYTSMAGPGWVCRPNVICLFRLYPGGSPTHLSIKAVRPELSGWDKFWGKEFRSNNSLYDDEDNSQTLQHELGHALDQLHIKALLGDQKCLVAINADDCYSEPDGIAPNIMGRGTGLLPVNAKPWLELIAVHTGVPEFRWRITQTVNTPPRKIPLGVALVGKPSQF